MTARITAARRALHRSALRTLIRVGPNGVPNFADASNKPSSRIAKAILRRVPGTRRKGALAGQTTGAVFEDLILQYLRTSFASLGHLRPGRWEMTKASAISEFDQYAHLHQIDEAIRAKPELAAILGRDYTFRPDLVVFRKPESDKRINRLCSLVDAATVRHASLRGRGGALPILHASVSCKFTIRSDRSQNSRSEALNLIRNRKGRTPHIVVVTAEPLPSRLGSLALGTGDIDCVYHFALYELLSAVHSLGYGDAEELLNVMVDGNRLRDISDLPLDLAV